MSVTILPSPRALVAVLALLLVGGCAEPAPLRIGVVVSMEAIAGARLAAAEINAAGGIDGRPLELIIGNGGGNTIAGLAITSAESLAVDASVVAVVGHSNSSASLSASQIYNRRGLVQIAPTSSAPLLSDAGPWTFRLVGSDFHQARFLADRIVAAHATARMAVFYVNDDYGHALHLELIAQLATRGIAPVYQAPYAENTDLPNADAMVRTLLQSEPGLVVWLGRSRQLRQIMPVLRHAIPDIQVLASDGIDNGMTAANKDGMMTGTQHVCFLDLKAPTDALRELQRRFAAEVGTELTAEAALTYDAVMVVALAMRTAGPSRDKIRGYLDGLGTRHPPYDGVSGRIAFDPSGDVVPHYCLATVTAPSAAAPAPMATP